MRERLGGGRFGFLGIGLVGLLAACATQEDLRQTQRYDDKQRAELRKLLDETTRDLQETRQLGAELESRLREIKAQDLSQVSGQLEALRHDMGGLHSRLDDQQATLFALEKRGADATGQLQTALTTMANKLDQTEAAAGRVSGVDQGLTKLTEMVKEIGTTLATQVDQQAVSLTQLQETLKQTDQKVHALEARVQQVQGTLTGFEKTLRSLDHRATDLDRRVTELAGKTRKRVGVPSRAVP